MIVVDASVLAPALADDGEDGVRARTRLTGQVLVAPELVYLETASVLRGLASAGKLDPARAETALAALVQLPLHRASHRDLLRRCWELRGNLTPYDASYIALAELLEVAMVTGDARLAGATGARCRIDLQR